MVNSKAATVAVTEAQVWNWLADVSDPEVPVLSVLDLGIVRAVRLDAASSHLTIVITPTYSGCPAMDVIGTEIRLRLAAEGIGPQQLTLENQLSPAWTTDWLSAEGRRKLTAYGIAPPAEQAAGRVRALFGESPVVQCPHCGSNQTQLLSQFGSTACKALYQCQDCREPFDYFKCH